jgi:uncharacterized membrane protein YsdA (DUF1294 family)
MGSSYWINELMILGLTWINIYGYLVIRFDKNLARKSSSFRIPELSIWKIAFLFGAVGIFMGMLRHRHKTRHRLLVWGIGMLLILQVTGGWFLAWRFGKGVLT